jgi:hypothetical protein
MDEYGLGRSFCGRQLIGLLNGPLEIAEYVGKTISESSQEWWVREKLTDWLDIKLPHAERGCEETVRLLDSWGQSEPSAAS